MGHAMVSDRPISGEAETVEFFRLSKALEGDSAAGCTQTGEF